MVGDRKVLWFVTYRAQMLYETVSESTLGLTNIEEATLGAADTVDQADKCAGEPESDKKDLFWVLNGARRGSNEAALIVIDVAEDQVGEIVPVQQRKRFHVSWVSKFADDTKVGGVVDSAEG
eukprot:g17249.t1